MRIQLHSLLTVVLQVNFWVATDPDELVLGLGQDALQADDDHVVDDVRPGLQRTPAHMLLLKTDHCLGNQSFELALCARLYGSRYHERKYNSWLPLDR